MSDFDVIIVGGRPAGSTLAARLGRAGLNVLLLERATFPSLPAASSPIIYAATMKMLDEIGADETKYARDTPQISHLHFVSGEFGAAFPIPEDDGRDYAYAIDRARFDHALWNHAASFICVDARQGFHVTDLLWNGEQVTGITGKDADGVAREYTADLVVGADGRFGVVGRKTEAQVRDQNDDFPTTLHYAYWKNLKPHDESGQATSVAYEGQRGVGYLAMDSADNTAAVCVEGQAGLLEAPPGQITEFYLEMLERCPALWRRLEGAEMVTKVRGMRKISNLYREAGGPGWALVGDAYHQKDPLDGQGIYNAVFTAKALAWAIFYWRRDEKTWDEAVAWYDETARIKTYAMYKSLLTRVRESLYPQAEIPEWVQQTVMRYVMDDPDMHKLFGRFITRQIPADAMTFMTPAVMARAMVRGGLRDLRQRVEDRLPFPAARR